MFNVFYVLKQLQKIYLNFFRKGSYFSSKVLVYFFTHKWGVLTFEALILQVSAFWVIDKLNCDRL